MFQRFQVRRPLSRSQRGFENWAAVRMMRAGIDTVRHFLTPRPNPPSPSNSPNPQNNPPNPQNNSPSPSPTISDVSDISDISDVSDVSNVSNSDSNQENDDSNQESEENENESNEEDDEDDDKDGADEDEDEAELPDEIRRTTTNGVTITLRRYKESVIYISRDGNYRSTHNINRLFPASNAMNDSMYPTYTNGSTNLNIQINQMVASCWVPNPNNWYFICHKDGNRQNCHYTNLEWVRLQYHNNATYGYHYSKITSKVGTIYHYHTFNTQNPKFCANFKTKALWNQFRRRAEPIMNQYNQDGNATTFKQSMKQLATQIKSGH